MVLPKRKGLGEEGHGGRRERGGGGAEQEVSETIAGLKTRAIVRSLSRKKQSVGQSGALADTHTGNAGTGVACNEGIHTLGRAETAESTVSIGQRSDLKGPAFRCGLTKLHKLVTGRGSPVEESRVQ